MSSVQSFPDISNVNHDEISKFQENKTTEVCTKFDSNWKMTIKEKMEFEINRRVREALDTPPLERIRKRQQEAILRKSQQDDSKKSLNSHLRFNQKQKLKCYNDLPISANISYKTENWTDDQCHLFKEDSIINTPNKFEYWLKPFHESQQNVIRKSSSKLNDIVETALQKPKPLRTGFEALQNFGNLTQREKEIYFGTFTKEGFNRALKTGRLPDGSKLEQLTNGSYKDKYGIIRDMDGPFWPKDIGPLHPVPYHKRINSQVELLTDPLKERNENLQNFHNQTLNASHWRYAQIVYDSEHSARNQDPIQSIENVFPSLIFESRFESGNLRQARRIGQFEYELVLNYDLYTKRHTQWFYFRILNMVKNVTYKFIIINLLKPTSLYMQGMRMLLYSEKNTNDCNFGWYRTGHNIRYSRNVNNLQCPLLSRDISYFQLEFQLEFPHTDDTCYLSHCFPYTFTDLKLDLNKYLNDKRFITIFQKEVLCETKIGNSCFFLTITDKSIPDNEKLGAVITARVHPGETNSSWMMNGLIQYLISDCEIAKNLRKRILFKIVPMLNPDGVIVGNYRCSTAGRDLNRNYRCPREESFPTVFHTKKLVEKLKSICTDVALYCDLHGHSRKHNVFMYGCDSQYINVEDVNGVNPVLNANTVQTFIKDRIFPFLMQKNGPEIFCFAGCQFKIRKCKESTGRVVMWKQFNITDSYTLEATFSGSDLINRRHFNISDLENIGKIFSESLSTYITIMNDEKMEKELSLELLKTIFKQIISRNDKMIYLFRRMAFQKNKIRDNTDDKDVFSEENTDPDFENDIDLDLFINNFQLSDIQELDFTSFQVTDLEENLSSSDSDSESQPEEIPENERKLSIKVKKRKKKLNAQTKKSKDISLKTLPLKKVEAKVVQDTGSTVESKTVQKLQNDTKKISAKVPSLRQSPLFSSKYEGRSNGGIPFFAEERLLERARRRSVLSNKNNSDESLYKISVENNNETRKNSLKSEDKLKSLYKSSDEIVEEYLKLRKQANNILFYRSCENNNSNEASENIDRIIQKPVLNTNQIREISKSKCKQHIVLKAGSGQVFKSIASEVPLEVFKEANNKFSSQIKRKFIKHSSPKNVYKRYENTVELSTNDYIKWLNKYYRNIFSQLY